MFAREATDLNDPSTVFLARDSMDRDALAIQQLENSPFFFNAKITDEFVSANFSSFEYLPNINVNTGEIVSQNDF
jgi:hypothetical protein